MAIAYVQGAQSFNNPDASSISLAFGSNNSSGGFILVCVFWKGDVTISSVTDTQGNSYVDCGAGRLARPTDGYLQVLGAANIAAGANTVTVNFSASTSGSRELFIAEYSGVASSSPFDVTATGTHSAGGDTVTTSAFTPGVPAGAVVAFGVVNLVVTTSSMLVAGNAGTLRLTPTDWGEGVGDYIYGTSLGSNITASMTWNGGGITKGALIAAVLKQATSTYTYTPSGGVSLAGSAQTARTLVPPVSGGIVLAGAALYSRVFAALTSGGITFTGDALASFHPGGGGASEFIYAGSGGVVFGGAALVEFLRNLPPPPRGRWLGRRATERLLLRQRRSWDGPPTPR